MKLILFLIRCNALSAANRSTSRSSLSRQDFFWFWWTLAPGFLFLASFSTWDLGRLFLCCYHKRLDVRHWNCSTSISWERGIWLVDCLLIPTNHLTPDVTWIVFLYTFVESFWLVLNSQLFRFCSSIWIHINITFPYRNFLSFYSGIICWCKVSLCLWVHH